LKGIYSIEDYALTQKSASISASSSKEIEIFIKELELKINKQFDSKTRQLMEVEKTLMQLPELKNQIQLINREI